MSKKVLIIEIDPAVSGGSRAALEVGGYSAQETADPRGSVDLIRRSRPDLVVLAVDLGPGQSGYLICSKLKKDTELKSIPLIIIGPPDGFEKHSKLKTTRADDYIAKPFEPEELVARIGRLIGFPDDGAFASEEEGFAQLVEPEETLEPEEVVSVEAETTIRGDPDLELLDAAFDRAAPAESSEEPNPDAAWDHGAESSEAAYQPNPESQSADSYSESLSGTDDAEGHELRVKVDELQQSLAQAQQALSETQQALAETRKRAEQAEAKARSAESVGAKPGIPGKSEKDYFALKDSLSKRDHEILQLKTQLTDREKEILELHDRETQLEHQVAEDAETLSQRESELAEAREKLAQSDLTSEEMRSRAEHLEAAMQQAQSEAAELREEVEAVRGELQAAHSELEQAQAQVSQGRADMDSARSQLATQASVFAQDAESLRAKIREMEASSSKNEERIEKLYQRIKGDEKLREKTKKALSIALQLLDEQQSLSGKEDEPATA